MSYTHEATQAEIEAADELHRYSIDTYNGSVEIIAYSFGQALRLAEEDHEVLAICEVE